jgi:hypothetical protein
MRALKTSFLALLFSLAACGGGGSDAPTRGAEPVEYVPAAKLVVIGNSITYVPATPELGWDHGSGMAASSAATDYAHLVAAGLDASALAISNFADLERNPTDAINRIDMDTPVARQIAQHAAEVTPQSAVVIQLGDNAPHDSMSTFGPAYGALLDAVAARQTLVCVSTWWQDGSKDAVIRAACEGHGGRFVFIGDIGSDPANRDHLDGPQYMHAGVQAHPHDWSMARIAGRVLAALER